MIKDKKNNKAFSLVELIVVIIILAILGTIAFISLQGYSKNARDSTRISDLSSMKTSLEVFQLDTGKYPIPTNGTNIIYSGATVWTQGSFGETVYTNVSKLDKIPTDPITDAKYTYSVTQNRGEYQLGGMIEGDTISFSSHTWKEGLGVAGAMAAGTVEARAIVTGTYNGQVTKSLSGSTLCNILAVPSIITNDTSITDLETINTQNRFVYRGQKNLPSSFKSSKFNNEGGFAFSVNKLPAYTDTTNACKELTSKTNITARVQMLKGIQDAYSGTILKNEGEIKNILALDISDVNNPNTATKNYAGLFVNNNLGGSVTISGGLGSSSGSETNSNTSSIYKYRVSYTNGDYFSVNASNTFDNGLKLTQNSGTNLCLGKTVTCNASVTNCSNSCNETSNNYSTAPYDGGQTGTTWLKYDLVTPAVVDNLSIIAYYASGYEAIKDFELYGSNDDSIYTKIGTGTHLNDTTSTYLNYPINNSTAYRYYRFDILSHYAGNGNNNRMLRDLKLQGSPYYSTTPSTTETISGNTMIFSTLGVTSIEQININDTLPSGTNTKYLISFDGKTSWKYYNGTSWVTAAGGLSDIETLGMTSSYVNSLTTSDYSGIENETSIDFAVSLSTTNTANTPTVNYIDISYNTSLGTSQNITCNQYKTANPSATDGVYLVYPGYKYPKSIYCDMTTDGGGWALVTNALSNAPTADTLGNSLSTDFIASQDDLLVFTQNSTETRYSCKNGATEIDIKTSEESIRDRQYQTGTRCTEGFFYTLSSPSSYFTGIGNNNYSTFPNNATDISCSDVTNYKLNTYSIGFHYTHWQIRDPGNAASWSMKCGGTSTNTEYMRVRIR